MKKEHQTHLFAPTQREQEDTLLALGESELGDLILGAQDRTIIRQIKYERRMEEKMREAQWPRLDGRCAR